MKNIEKGGPHSMISGYKYRKRGILKQNVYVNKFLQLSVCTKVAQGAIFMEQNMIIGLILGRLAILKIFWGRKV